MNSSVLRYVALLGVMAVSAFAFAADEASALYNKNCMNCHGADGSGKTNAKKKMAMPDLREKKFVDMSDAEMFETIGRGKNHAEYPHTYLYTGMDESQVKGLVAYIRTLQKVKPSK